MANQEQQQQSNSTPLIIIGLVLLVAIGGGYWLYSSSQSKPVTGATNTPTTQPANNQQQQVNNDQASINRYNSAPIGAQPPHSLGSPNSAVTVEEFADFQCPTCASVHGLMKQVNSQYGNRIRFIFRNFPLTQIHANANNAAVAAEAAGIQGKFWDMQNLLFTNQKEWSNVAAVQPLFEKYATTIGLDVEKFKSDYVSMTVRSRIDNDVARARALGVNSTPTIFINGKAVPYQQMTLQGLSGIIDYELKTAQDKEQSNSQTSSNETTDAKNTESNETNSEAKPEDKK